MTNDREKFMSTSISTAFMKLVIAATMVAGALMAPASFALESEVAADEVESMAFAPVNINTADAETLARVLTGIGESKAAAIVAWREAKGEFKSLDELTQVKGIGQATLEKNRDRLSL
jgi:competence protein ComEA